MKWKQIAAVLTGVVLVGSAIGVINQYRFWASAEELIMVADTAYSAKQDTLTKRRVEIEFMVKKCEATNCEDLKIYQEMLIEVDSEIKDKEEELKSIKDGD